MLTAVARSAVRSLNAPAQQVAAQSRNAFTLPLIFSGQRFYSATASEATEHPDPSSTATITTTRPRAGAGKQHTAATRVVKDNKAHLAKAEKEKLKAAAQKEKLKAAAQKEKLKAAAEKQKQKLKAVAEQKKMAAEKAEKAKALRLAEAEKKQKAAERAKKQKLVEAEKAKKEREKAKAKAPQVAEDAEIAAAVSNILIVPKRPKSTAFPLYWADKMNEREPSTPMVDFLRAVAKKWNNEDAAVKAEYASRAEAAMAAYRTALSDFVLAHTPLEIFTHNRCVRLLKKKGVSGRARTIKYKLSPVAKLTELTDPRDPGHAPVSRNLYMQENFPKTEGTSPERLSKLSSEYKSLSDEEKKVWETKADDLRVNVWAPAMSAAFGMNVLEPGKIPLKNKSAPSTAA